MKILCDVCENVPATLMCCADEAALCSSCDSHIHAANKLASKHQRLQLITPSPEESTPCDICQEKTGYFFCLDDRALLCRSCDFSIHSSNDLTCNHRRFIVTGSRVSLDAVPTEDVHPVVTSPGPKQAVKRKGLVPMNGPIHKPKKNAPVPAVVATTQSNPGSNFLRRLCAPSLNDTSILPDSCGKASPESLMTEALEGWGTDGIFTVPHIPSGYNVVEAEPSKAEAPFWDLDWPVDLNFLEEQAFGDSSREVPQMSSPTISGRPKCPTKFGCTKSKCRAELFPVSEFDDDFCLVPDLDYDSAPSLSPSSPKRRRTSIQL